MKLKKMYSSQTGEEIAPDVTRVDADELKAKVANLNALIKDIEALKVV